MSITKAERLQELRDQEQFYKVLDKYFDAGWRQYVKGIRQENDLSNVRMFKILAAIKGNDFVSDLIKFMRSTGNKWALLSLTKKPKGILLKDSRFPSIAEIMVDKCPSGSYRAGSISIQVKENRWVKFTY